jgi:hypothetical protein
LTLSISGDSSRILRVRALDRNNQDKVLSDPKQTNFTGSQPNPSYESSGPFQQTGTAYISLLESPTNFVVLEFTVAENVETISVPFEAQVDFGVAKAGPVAFGEPQAPAAPGGTTSQPWPPPAKPDVALPPVRSPFVPKSSAITNTIKGTNSVPAPKSERP